LKLKENLNEIQTEISQVKEIDVTQIDRWLVKQNLKLQSVKSANKGIEERFPKIQRIFYLFEAKDIPDYPIFLCLFYKNVLNVSD
jgi:hypothetical protein